MASHISVFKETTAYESLYAINTAAPRCSLDRNQATSFFQIVFVIKMNLPVLPKKIKMS